MTDPKIPTTDEAREALWLAIDGADGAGDVDDAITAFEAAVRAESLQHARAESAQELAALREALIGLDAAWQWVGEHYPVVLTAIPSLQPFDRARAIAATPAEDPLRASDRSMAEHSDTRSHCPRCGEWRDSPTADCAACGYAPTPAEDERPIHAPSCAGFDAPDGPCAVTGWATPADEIARLVAERG